MKNMLKSELAKAIKNPFFFAAVGIGLLLTMLSLIYETTLYGNHLDSIREFSAGYAGTYNPRTPTFTVFNCWVGGESASLGTAVFFFVFPLLAAIPYGWSYCEERLNGYTRSIVPYTGKAPYFLAKYIAVFVSGGLAVVIPLAVNFLMALMIFPAVTPIVTYDVYYGVFGGSLMSALYYTQPFLYVLFYLCIDFVYCGLLACISLAASSFIRQKWIVVILPLFYCLAFDLAGRFYYTSSTTIYPQISPLYFLRPVQTGYHATWGIIIGTGLFVFLITFAVSIFWERKHEIY